MNELVQIEAYGKLVEPGTLKVQRLLPGPIDRVWDYLTHGDLRRQWLAAGEMELKQGAEFELVWRNNELMDDPGNPPEGFGEEHRMKSRITELDPPRRLGFTWGDKGGSVTFELEPQGKEVLLTLTHRGLEGDILLNVAAGWHAHLDVLASRAAKQEPEPFWDRWSALRGEYSRRLSR